MTLQIAFSDVSSPVPEPRLNRSEVLERWRYLVKVGAWPPLRLTDPERWLHNFHPDEQEVALGLLNAFVYFNSEMTDRLLETSIRQLAAHVTQPGPYIQRKTEWLQFLGDVQVTHLIAPEDREDETKSGYMFARKTRQILSSPEQIRPAAKLASDLVNGLRKPVVVVDDFAGSGDQFKEGWTRRYELPDGSKISYAELSESGIQVYFCPAMCTSTAIKAIAALPGSPAVSAAHVLSERMSVLHPQSDLLPAYVRDDVKPVIERATERSGSQDEAFGWGGLGLALGFEHNTPDTTLPIFYCEEDGWNRLVTRR